MQAEFRGSCRRCADPAPHAAHWLSEYPTVRWGWLDRFCPGSGPLAMVRVRQGSAEEPAVYRLPTAQEAR